VVAASLWSIRSRNGRRRYSAGHRLNCVLRRKYTSLNRGKREIYRVLQFHSTPQAPTTEIDPA
jgi:hypothetical protein